MTQDTLTRIIEVGKRPKADFYFFKSEWYDRQALEVFPPLYRSIDVLLRAEVSILEPCCEGDELRKIVVEWQGHGVRWQNSRTEIGEICCGDFADRQEV